MVKYQLLNMFKKHNDIFIKFNNKKEFLYTIDFDNKYIKQFNSRHIKLKKNEVIAFNWDKNKFEKINCNTVQNITPLSHVLRNQ